MIENQMIENIFIASYLIFPLLIIFTLKKIHIRLLNVSIPSILILSMFAFSYIGILPLYFEWDYDKVINDKITDTNIVLKMFIFSTVSIFSMCIGFVFANKIFNLKLNNYNTLSNETSNLDNYQYYIMLLLSLICFLTLGLYLYKTPSVAIFLVYSEYWNTVIDNKLIGIPLGWKSVTSNSFSISNARDLMVNSFENYHIYQLFMVKLQTFLTFIFFSSYLNSKKTITLLMFLVSALVSMFVAIMTTEKYPILMFIVGLYFVYCLTLNNSKLLNKYSLIFSIILSMVVIYIMFTVTKSSSVLSFGFIIEKLFSRIFLGTIQPAYYYIQMFPEHHQFLNGTSFPNPKEIFPFKHFHLTKEVATWAFPNESFSYMPTVFWAEAYANFGFSGIIFVSFFVGITVWVFSFCLNKLKNSVIKISLIVWFALHIKDLSISNFSSYFADTDATFILIITFIILLPKILITYKNKSIK